MMLKDIHNIKQQVKKSARNNLSEAELMMDIVENLKDEGYTVELESDSSGQFQMLFIQSPAMCSAFQRNPDIVFVDATYKTSKQGYVLQCFAIENEHATVEHVAYAFLRHETEQYLSKVCSLFKQQNSSWQNIKMFFVDKDSIEIKVLRDIFEGATVLLCSFHVIKHWKKKIAELVLNKGDKASLLATLCSILYSETLERYESGVRRLKEECPDKKFLDYFLKNWDAQRQMWAHLFRKDLPTMGNNTNNRIESHFQKLKVFLGPNLPVSETITELIRFIDRQESERDFLHSRMTMYQFVDTRCDDKMVMDLSQILTDSAFKIVAEELHRSLSSDISIAKNNDTYSVHCNHKGKLKSFTVDEAMTQCSCKLSVSFGLLCSHIISCRKSENLPLDDPSLIHPRWRKVDFEPELVAATDSTCTL